MRDSATRSANCTTGGVCRKGGRTEEATNYSGAPLVGKLNQGGVCRKGREDGGGDKRQTSYG